MKNFLLIIGMLLCAYEGFGQPIGYMNVWERAHSIFPMNHRQTHRCREMEILVCVSDLREESCAII